MSTGSPGTPQPTSTEALLAGLTGRVAIVGNGTPARPFGALIDAYDVVIRLNNYRLDGFEHLVGRRTDFRCTTGFRDIEHRNEVPEFSPFRADAVESAFVDAYNRANASPLLTAVTDVHLLVPETSNPSCGLALVQLCATVGLDVDLFAFDGFQTAHYWAPAQRCTTTHSLRELDIILRRPNVHLFGDTYPYASLYDFCHARHEEYDDNAGLALVRWMGREFHGQAILEFGAGNGALSAHLEAHGNRVTAVEVSAEAFRKIACSTPIQGDAFTLASLPGPFDTFVSVDVLEHLTENDIRVVLREAGRLASSIFLSVSTRPSGLLGPRGENLHLTVRPTAWWLEQVGRYFDVAHTPGHGEGQLVLEGPRRPRPAKASPVGRFFLPAAYLSRARPSYFEDEDAEGRTWQPHVYPLTAALARRAGSTTVIDVGCGRARKLASLQDEFQIVGLDYGVNLEHCRRSLPRGQWHEVDLVRPWPVRFDDELLRRSVIVSADVIEHLEDPTELLKALADLSRSAAAVVVSTPERTRTWGRAHWGPPPNPAHVREWSLDELARLATHHGLVLAFAGVTASEDATFALNTSVLVASPAGASRDDRTSLGVFCRETLAQLHASATRARRAAARHATHTGA